MFRSKKKSKGKSLERCSFKRQWGSEKNVVPLSYMHDKPTNFVIAYSRIAIVLTIVFWLMYITDVIIRQLIDGPQDYQFTAEVVGYSTIVTFLTLSALIYLITRQGALQSFKKHMRAPQRVLDEHFATHRSSITVLVPSYSEEVQVIRKTLLSAALQEHPDLNVVLLLDDEPFRVRPEHKERIEQTLQLGAEIEALLSEPLAAAMALRTELEKTNFKGDKKAIERIVAQYEWTADWLEHTAKIEVIEDHVDMFFADQVLCELAGELRAAGREQLALRDGGVQFTKSRVEQLCNRLVWIFQAKVSLFERKRYISLSHERNKAMNLNAYIGLMGGMYHKEQTAEGTILMKTNKADEADLVIRDTDFILTLDADSVLLRGYCARLVHFLEQPNNADVAVVQTPYSSFRGAPSRLERLSGATTDIQHIIHQGMSHYGATFWVGANAVIRKRALEDIVETEFVGGFEVKRYVQDHTVIEDTESSIDMALHDWRLVNYPERLSYSATPPDFGSLVVQRLRWANGGLLIFPKLLKLRHKRKHEGRPMSKLEFLIRTNYMVSIAWSSAGLVFLLAYPYDGRLLSPLVLLAAAPYFIAMSMDLKYCRYNYTDIFRIYGFNLILLPVNIAGTLKSLQQAITTKKIPFARTPKVKNRTATNWLYLIAPLAIVIFSLFTLWRNIEGQNWGNAAFAGFNAFAAMWAIVAYIGVKNMIVDLWLALVDVLYVEVPVTPTKKRSWNWPRFGMKRGLVSEGN
ncbi:MAG: glycosyltransferase [Candidatus Kaiserbacteria bacterium]|nr:glycosyltransferase [Candidatus Kaiserbacteria bacterium]MCB9816800.1 glycosyltransferase [Candidatus Nomurabacteria bacterium]